MSVKGSRRSKMIKILSYIDALLFFVFFAVAYFFAERALLFLFIEVAFAFALYFFIVNLYKKENGEWRDPGRLIEPLDWSYFMFRNHK